MLNWRLTIIWVLNYHLNSLALGAALPSDWLLVLRVIVADEVACAHNSIMSLQGKFILNGIDVLRTLTLSHGN